MTRKVIVFMPSTGEAYRMGDNVPERYWTGNYTDSGHPQTTNEIGKAYGFLDRRSAYRAAGEAKMLSWRVGMRPKSATAE